MEISAIVPEGKSHEVSAFVEKAVKGKGVPSFETQRLTKEGQTLDVWLTVSRLENEHGELYAIATTERDVTGAVQQDVFSGPE